MMFSVCSLNVIAAPSTYSVSLPLDPPGYVRQTWCHTLGVGVQPTPVALLGLYMLGLGPNAMSHDCGKSEGARGGMGAIC